MRALAWLNPLWRRHSWRLAILRSLNTWFGCPVWTPDILHVRVAQTVGELVSVTRGVVGEPLIEMGLEDRE